MPLQWYCPMAPALPCGPMGHQPATGQESMHCAWWWTWETQWKQFTQIPLQSLQLSLGTAMGGVLGKLINGHTHPSGTVFSDYHLKLLSISTPARVFLDNKLLEHFLGTSAQPSYFDHFLDFLQENLVLAIQALPPVVDLAVHTLQVPSCLGLGWVSVETWRLSWWSVWRSWIPRWCSLLPTEACVVWDALQRKMVSGFW